MSTVVRSTVTKVGIGGGLGTAGEETGVDEESLDELEELEELERERDLRGGKSEEAVVAEQTESSSVTVSKVLDSGAEGDDALAAASPAVTPQTLKGGPSPLGE